MKEESFKAVKGLHLGPWAFCIRRRRRNFGHITLSLTTSTWVADFVGVSAMETPLHIKQREEKRLQGWLASLQVTAAKGRQAGGGPDKVGLWSRARHHSSTQSWGQASEWVTCSGCCLSCHRLCPWEEQAAGTQSPASLGQVPYGACVCLDWLCCISILRGKCKFSTQELSIRFFSSA